MCVRRPAAFSSNSRSNPIAAPSAAATPSRSSVTSQPTEGMSTTRSIDCPLLCLLDPVDPLRRQLEQLVELVATERHALGRGLHLDEAVVAGHDDVQVDVGARVLDVVEVEQELAADDPER